MKATALIAEDEPLLALALQAELARAWPELQVLATVGDGLAAVREALALQPQVLFFDVRMPGQSGLEAAAELAERWPDASGHPPFPVLVFVTAFDQYAVAAFEAQALDYLLKPVQPERLRRTVERVQVALQTGMGGDGGEGGFAHTLAQLRAVLPAPAAIDSLLEWLQIGVGQGIEFVPVAEVLVFEAADKYVRVLTAQREYLLRTPLKDLLPQLDARQFWQIHRSTVVRSSAIARVQRDSAGRLSLSLRQRSERFAVSRLYAHRFAAM